jgi:hypothetical protein
MEGTSSSEYLAFADIMKSARISLLGTPSAYRM